MDLENSYLAYPIAGLVLQYIRRLLDTGTRFPRWDRILKNYWAAGGIVLGAGILLSVEVTIPLWAGVLFATSYTMWLDKSYRLNRTVILAIAPTVVIYLTSKLVKWIAPIFHDANDDYFGSAGAFSFLWLVAFAVIANRQKKSLIKTEEERAIEAEQRRIIEARKQELEYLVAERTAEIRHQKEELEQTLNELKLTQTQLIQSEKMASLGELTAGIAHEIQNPLNFVNNFAEISSELIDELTDERHKPQRDTDLEAELLADIKQNLQKITHHGSRASSIVKGMLQHSRASSWQREPTDLNALTEEYLRLAYHGLRAKDKAFNAKLSTDFDASIGLTSVVPQDMGRVLLNLFTNAFYAVQQRQKYETSDQKTSPYEPTVTVRTRCVDGQVALIVIDNGTGIPADMQPKIFQPFFTTKPTGEGTGLGLSLSYDIVTKGHGGTMQVESKEGEGSQFTVLLPA